MARPRRAVPTGTLTFLFSDIEDSTRLVQELDTARYRELLEQHQRLLRASFSAHGGMERSTEGDSFFVVFRDAPSAVAAAVDGQRRLSAADWPSDRGPRVRMGLHSGEGIVGGDDYVGIDVHRAARIAAAAHGGQVIVSESTRALTHHSLPRDVALTDLGEHHLKGLAFPERLYQLTIAGMPSTFPPPRTDRAAGDHLPPRLTSFVGREEDVDSLESVLAINRVVTLVGPGGAGKTSLATECARAASGAFVEGAWFVALEAIADPELVASAIVGALGLKDAVGQTVRQHLQENLARRDLLLLLDNFEQVMPASALVAELVISAPTIKFLVTSRAPLHLAAEQLYPVAPLPVPSPPLLDGATPPASLDATALEALSTIPSVRLFVDRVQQVQPSFRLSGENAEGVADICSRLDGLPLGIELAAARVPLLGVAGVGKRLAGRVDLPAGMVRDAPARQRTLHQAIAWSYDLLDAPGRTLLARLAIFAGGWRLEEAEAVCGPATELGGDVLDTLAELVDQSLVIAREQRGLVRYEMLETIRQFAALQLASREDQAEIGRRHAIAYLDLAEESAPAIRLRNRVPTLERIGLERDNLRAAVRWSMEHEDAQTALRFGTALVELRAAPPWGLGTGIQEASSTILAVLNIPGADAPTAARMRALEAAGTAFYYSGDNERAGAFYRAQLALADQLGDLQGATDARFDLAWTEDWTTRLDEGQAWCDRVEAGYQALGDERGLARLMFFRGTLLLGGGRAREAIAIFEAAMARYRELDDLAYRSMTAGSIGAAYLEIGDREAAVHAFIGGMIVTAREVGDDMAMTMTLPIGAIAAFEAGRPEAAAVIMGAYESLSRGYGVRAPVGLEAVFNAYDPLGRVQTELDAATFEAAMQRGRDLRLDQAVALVLEMDVAADDTRS